MNQDKDVLDDACLTVDSDALDDCAPIGGDQSVTFNKLRELLENGYEIERGDS